MLFCYFEQYTFHEKYSGSISTLKSIISIEIIAFYGDHVKACYYYHVFTLWCNNIYNVHLLLFMTFYILADAL